MKPALTKQLPFTSHPELMTFNFAYIFRLFMNLSSLLLTVHWLYKCALQTFGWSRDWRDLAFKPAFATSLLKNTSLEMAFHFRHLHCLKLKVIVSKSDFSSISLTVSNLKFKNKRDSVYLWRYSIIASLSGWGSHFSLIISKVYCCFLSLISWCTSLGSPYRIERISSLVLVGNA
jgi:hypothetical protein